MHDGPRGRGEEWDLTLVADPAAGGSSQKVTELLGEWDYCKCIIWTKWFDFKHLPSNGAVQVHHLWHHSGYLEQVEGLNRRDHFLNGTDNFFELVIVLGFNTFDEFNQFTITTFAWSLHCSSMQNSNNSAPIFLCRFMLGLINHALSPSLNPVARWHITCAIKQNNQRYCMTLIYQNSCHMRDVEATACPI